MAAPESLPLTVSEPPVKIVVLLAEPEPATSWLPPALMNVRSAVPETICRRRLRWCCSRSAGLDHLRTVGEDCGAARQAKDILLAARNSRAKVLAPDFDRFIAGRYRRAARRAGGLDHLRTGKDRGAAGQPEDILLAARNLCTQVGALGADDLQAAAVDRRRIGQTAGKDLERAAADDRVGSPPAGLDDLRAAEDRGAAGKAEVELRAAADPCAVIDSVDINSMPPLRIVVVLATRRSPPRRSRRC